MGEVVAETCRQCGHFGEPKRLRSKGQQGETYDRFDCAKCDAFITVKLISWGDGEPAECDCDHSDDGPKN